MPQQRLLNTCSWSSSRESTFHECRKKYWYTYYGAWDGWPLYYNDPRGKNLDPLAARLYLLKNMQPLAVYIGSVVHKVIENILTSVQGNQGKSLPPLSAILQEGEKLFLKGLGESTQQQWKRHPKKHTNILEHYYSIPLDSEATERAKEKVRLCLESWYNSPCIQKIALDPRADWGKIEQAMNFEVVPGIHAIVVFDFYLTWKRSKEDKPPLLMIFDWKTGQESQKIEDQLYAYALAAKSLLNASHDAMILVPFYLAEGPYGYKKVGTDQIDAISDEKLAVMQERIIHSSREMLALHPAQVDEKGASTKPDPRLFPYTEQRSKCRRCPFIEVCEKAQFQEKSESELREMLTT